MWREIHFLDSVVQNITIQWEGQQFDYQQLCALNLNGYCLDNVVLDIGAFIDQIETGNISLTYPIWLRYALLFFLRRSLGNQVDMETIFHIGRKANNLNLNYHLHIIYHGYPLNISNIHTQWQTKDLLTSQEPKKSTHNFGIFNISK